MSDDGRTPAFELDTLAADGARQRTVAALFGDSDLATKVGDHEIVSLLGRGGMGVVYLAEDRRLDRKVALKRILSHRRGNAKARARLIAEAQQLARVQHPNVVTVFEVGVHEGHPFLVMEFVAGATLSDWVRAQPRSPAALLDIFVQAGEGLAAAHAASVLHLDFKPANILVTPEGVAKVADFGLAMFADESDPDTAEAVTTKDAVTDSSLSNMAGTPAFMAPEQFAGRVSERSDQFAFGLALLATLSGIHPFGGRPAYQLTEKSRREFLERLDRGRVPQRAFEVASRALELDPRDRWPSTRAMVDALKHNRRPSRTLLLCGAAIVGVATMTYAMTEQPDAGPTCADNRAGLADAWTEADRTKFDALVAAQATDNVAAEYLRERLDDYAEQWVSSRTSACETRNRDPTAEGLPDLRFACLDARRDELRATVDAILASPSAATENPVAYLGSLGELGACSDDDRLRSGAPLPPTRSASVVAHSRTLVAQARTALAVAAVEEADAKLAEARSLSRQVDYPPLHAEILAREGALASFRSNFAEAEEKLTEAYFLADSIGYDAVADDAASELAFMTSTVDPRPPQESARWARLATASAERAKTSGQMRHLSTLATVAHGRGDHETALSLFERARQAPSTAGPLGAAKIGNNMAVVLRALGRHEEAQAKLLESLELHRSLLGDAHTLTATAELRLATVLRVMGRPDEALPHARRAHEFLGDRSDRSGLEACSGYGLVLRDVGDVEEGCARLEECVELATRLTSADHVLTASHRVNVAACLQAQWEWDEASAHLRRALGTFEAAGSPHADVARHALASVLLASTRLEKGAKATALREEAAALARLSSSSIAERVGADAAATAGPLMTEGTALLQLGRLEQAEEVLLRALTIRRAHDRPPKEIGAVEFGVSVTRWERHGDPEELARAHQRARALDVDLGDGTWTANWLKAHPLPRSRPLD